MNRRAPPTMVPARHHDSVAVSVADGGDAIVVQQRAGRQAVFVRARRDGAFDPVQSVVLPSEALSQAVSRHTEMW